NFGKALTGAWYEIMATMSADDDAGKAARTFMAKASGTDLAGYDAQLASTRMFYKASEAVTFVNSPELKDTMQKVAEFSFDHGLLGEGAPDAGFVGIETPVGVFGSESNVQLRFIADYMAMAADGKL
ncbi:MAG: lipid kinase, partial [Alcanivorax sp.]